MIALGLVLAVALGWVLGPGAAWVLAHFDGVNGIVGKDLAAALDAVRGRALAVATGVIALAAVFYTARNADTARQGHITDRYTKAIEQLGSDKLDIRLGGIYALERIARDSARDHPTVMEVLAAFIREHCRDCDSPDQQDGEERTACDRQAGPPLGVHSSPRVPGTDVQAALTVIGRRDHRQDRDRIDLFDADLRRAFLTGADLRRANLSGTNLSDANLSKADLRDAVLVHADLRHANLQGHNLGPGADLRDALLVGADLRGAKLSGADLRGAFLIGADLRDAHLFAADLRGAQLRGAQIYVGDLHGAKVTKEDVRGANLLDAPSTDAQEASPSPEETWPGE
ncbi:pentapeptide repeat-containing protein [Microbispora sp. H10885]|uniref:pentapeptide repeat-containing protein n=1 Tax=Microbispora sp. H10885 TaxID=2729110 RepID=UPI0016049585|nr:pentapeptide repeat-containing protein [Microbispora sp. H10885]